MRDEWFAATDRRNHGLDLALCQELAEAVGVVGFVGNQPLDWPGAGQQGGRHRDIVQVAWRQQQNARAAAFVAQGMDRRRPSAAGAPDRFVEGPPFPPVAERCAFT